MPTTKVSFAGQESALDALGVALSEVFFPPADAISLTKGDETRADDDTPWRLDAYFAEPPDAAALASLSQEAGVGEPIFETLPDIDWAAHALAGLGIVRAGRFVLYGAHDAARLPHEDGDIAIRIDANQAFGTGHHPTTAGCLTLLDRIAGMRPRQILDLGCGSAVLAIAAAKLWDRDVLAVDIDQRSVEIAAENAGINGVGARVLARLADGFDHPDVFEAAPFDFIFANILAGPLADFAPAMAAHMARSGRVMLAGLMSEQEEAVARAYERAGFRRLNRLDHPTWPVLLYVKT